jgi:hypothetical protein
MNTALPIAVGDNQKRITPPKYHRNNLHILPSAIQGFQMWGSSFSNSTRCVFSEDTEIDKLNVEKSFMLKKEFLVLLAHIARTVKPHDKANR